jgi:hypothetical protein
MIRRIEMMVRQLASDIRTTLHLHSAELRYVDPRTAQVYQGTAMLVMAASMLLQDFLKHTGHMGTGVWQSAAVLRNWTEMPVWSAIFLTLGIAILVTPAYSQTARFWIFCAFCLWFALTMRVFAMFGYLPLSTGLTGLFAAHAVHAYFRMRLVLNGGRS